MFAGIAAWLAESALMTSPVGAGLKVAGGLFGKIPKQVWYALAIVAALAAAYFWIQHKIHQAYAAGNKNGHTEQFAHDQAAMDKVRIRARQWKQAADTANEKIRKEEQTLHDQTIAHNHALADALRMRIRAQAQPGARGGGSLPGAARAADWSGGPQPAADAGLAGEATATVPAGQLIDYAEQADNDHDALIRIEDAWRRYQEKWPKPKPH